MSVLIRGANSGNTDEEPNESAKKFFELLKEAKQELYPGCSNLTKVSFMVRLFELKCMGGWSNENAERTLSYSRMHSPRDIVSLTLSRKHRRLLRE
jgi:hypothetical protein